MRTIRRITLRSAFLLAIAIAAYFDSALLAAPLPLTLNEPATTLPEAKAGSDYSYQFQAEGGLPPLTWRVKQGDLPPGLTLDTTGKLHGTPTQPRREPYQFTIEVADSAQPPQNFAQEFALMIQPAPLRIVTARQPLRIVNTPPDAAPRPEHNASLTAAEAPASKNDAKDAAKEVAKDAAANETKDKAADDNKETKTSYVVRGRVRPALLDEVFARIQSVVVKDYAELAAEAKGKWEKEKWEQAVAKVSKYLLEAGFTDHHSGADAKPEDGQTDEAQKRKVETVEQRRANERREAGMEKQAAVDLLTYVRNDKQLLAMFESHASRYPHLSKDTLEKLILMLNSYIDNVAVRVKKGDDVVATAFTDKGGEYEVTLAKDEDNKVYVFSTEADNHLTRREVVINDGSLACLPAKKNGNRIRWHDEEDIDCRDFKVNLLIEDRPVSLLTRAVVGYQQAGAASADFEQSYFFDLFVSQTFPFLQKINPDFGERWRVWGAIRSISAPQSGNVTIGGLANNLVTNISNLKANEAARVFDYLGGVEVRLPRFSNNSLLPSFDRDTKQKFSLSFIASFGFETPTNPAQTVKTFKISDQFRTEFEKTGGGAGLSGKDFVAFAQSDRDRFFRQYYAGVRMQTFYFNRHNEPMQRFPAQLDLQFGVNEYVTAGRVRGGVIRLDGYYPLPYENLKFINLFGTAIIKPVRSKVTNTLILEPVEDEKRFDPRTAILPISQFNRDYYRFGVGIDFVSFMGKLLRNN